MPLSKRCEERSASDERSGWMKRGRPPEKPGRAAMAKRNFACLAGTLIAMASVVSFLLPVPSALAGVKESVVGTSAGDFTLRDVAGKRVSLSDFRGKTVLLSFWATWCLPCKAELPTIENIYEQNKDKDVVVLAVDDENEVTIKKFMNDHHYGFMVLMDPKRALFERFVIYFIPTVLIINGKGIIVREIVGWHGSQKLLSAMKSGER